jgi:SAM-dependent methyltransferase
MSVLDETRSSIRPILTRITDKIRSLRIPACKICGSVCEVAFALPRGKKTGAPIPASPDDCSYFRCTQCQFLFATILDRKDNAEVYDEDYWNGQDPDWGGRVNQTLRLVMMGSRLVAKNPWELKVLDFGSGMGTFVAAARDQLQMQAWGTDLIQPKFGREFFLPKIDGETFDVIVACEVLEHLVQPMQTLEQIRGALNPGGVFAFQTAYYDPATCGRDWWYLGPANGHVSLYSRGAFDELFKQLGGKERLFWNDYPGLQAWRF